MINVSNAFKAALEDDNRNFSGSCTITLTSGKSIPIDDSKLWYNGFVVDDSTSNTGGFDIGSAIVQKFTLRLNNMYDEFTDYDFTGAEISDVKVSLDLSSGKQEAVSKGVFTVDNTSYDGDIITLECLDNMHKFDVSYEKSNLTYPATLLQIVQDACRCCGMILATDSLQFEYYNYVIQEKPEDNTMTFRDVLTWVGQISAHFWKCNKNGQLSAGWYNMSDLAAGTNIHILQTNAVTDVSVDLDDVVITCVRVVTEDENSDQVTYQSGSDGYAVVIDSNKFITNDNAAEIASMIGGRVVGLRFRPMTVSSLQDPTIEAGDGAVVYDRKLKSYKTFFTNVVFSIDADNQMSNGAESALRNSAERFSEASKIYQDLKKHLNKNKTEWEKAMAELEKAMKEQTGLYPVIKTLDDGSKIYYMCDHQTLEESQVVFELNGKGWAISTDGGKTWNAGLLVDGTMITKILNSIGINADWINTGTIKGTDEEGNTKFLFDVETGQCIIDLDELQIQGKDITQVTEEKTNQQINKFIKDTYAPSMNNLQSQVDGKIQTWHQDTDPSSEWSGTQNTPWTDKDGNPILDMDGNPILMDWEDIKAMHEGDLWYNTSNNTQWIYQSGTWVPQDIPNSVLNIIKEKSSVYVKQPVPPYEKGDLWLTSMNNKEAALKIAIITRVSGDFVDSDWIDFKYVDKNDVKNAINEYDTSLGQDEIFNKLTNGGAKQGIYIKDGILYINAEYILAGVLAGERINGRGLKVIDENNNVTFEIDKEGNVALKPKTFALTNGDTIYSIAQDTANSVAGSALSDAKDYADNLINGKMTKQEIINVLSDNSNNKGLYLINGELYINASYINTGELAGWIVDATNQILKSKGVSYGGELELDGGSGRIYAMGRNSVYVPGVGTIYGTSIEGSAIETGTLHSGGVSAQTVNATDVSASGKVTAGTHVEATGHFYSAGTGTDLADLSVRGTKKRILPTKNYGTQAFYCYEMASPIFGDIGEAVISEDGTCLIDIDDIFQESTNVEIEYYVFLQKEGEGDCWIDEKEQAYFTVKGTPGLKFTFEIKARQSNYEHMRFADASETAYDRAIDTDMPEPDYSESLAISEPDYETELIDERTSIINQMEVTS